MAKTKTFPTLLQVLPSLHSGGVERATLDMVKGIHQYHPKAGNYVASAGGVLVDEVNLYGGQHFTLPLNTKCPLTIYKNIKRLADLIKDQNIQLIHARSRAPAWSALRAARIVNIPFITTYHGVYNSNNFLKSVYNSIMARGDKVIAISQYVANHMYTYYPQFSSNVVVIPEGVDTDFLDPKKITDNEIKALKQEWKVPFDSKLILLPGRLTRWKGQEIILKALKLLDHTHLTVVLLGDDQGRHEYRLELDNLAKGLPVKFIPSCNKMPVAYAASDIVLSCSTDPEAFGRVTAEALAMERPYIGTNHGATPEMCIHGETGFLVPPGDIKALAEMIKKVLSLSSEDKCSLGQQAREHIVKNFSLDMMMKQTLELYQKVFHQ